MLFKSELTTASTMERMDQIVKALGAAGITAYTKTQDNFSGGLFENRRSTGTFGMDSAARYQYKIYVKREQLEQAKAVLAPSRNANRSRSTASALFLCLLYRCAKM